METGRLRNANAATFSENAGYCVPHFRTEKVASTFSENALDYKTT
jgi:hypothetical protein